MKGSRTAVAFDRRHVWVDGAKDALARLAAHEPVESVLPLDVDAASAESIDSEATERVGRAESERIEGKAEENSLEKHPVNVHFPTARADHQEAIFVPTFRIHEWGYAVDVSGTERQLLPRAALQVETEHELPDVGVPFSRLAVIRVLLRPKYSAKKLLKVHEEYT